MTQENAEIIVNEDRSSIPRPIWWLLVLLIAVILIAVVWAVQNVQTDLSSRSAEAVNSANMADIGVEFSGRDALLNGASSRSEEFEKAKDIVFAQEDVGRVDTSKASQQESSSRSSEPRISVQANNYHLLLEGILPSQQDVDRISAASAEQYSSVDNRLVVDSASRKAIWIENMPELFTQVDEWAQWDFTVNEKGTLFDGVAQNINAINSLRDGFLSRFEDLKFTGRINPNSLGEKLTELLAGAANFETASSHLSNHTMELLDHAVEILNANPTTGMIVEGHTDNLGKESSNRVLSQARAQAVVDHLVSGGVEPHRLMAIGRGETKPIADNSTVAGRTQNRRIKFEINTNGNS